MKRLAPEVMDYYDREVVKGLSDKYGYEPFEALRLFVFSETHELLEDSEMGLTSFGAGAILEIWEAEKITGNPRNSIYIRED